MMKLAGILCSAVVLFPLALAAQAQGVGDAQRGAQVFIQCKACHSLEAGKNMIGPSLHELLGRRAGTVPGFAYSPAMKNANVVWNDDTLSRYLTDPKGVHPRRQDAVCRHQGPEQARGPSRISQSSDEVAPFRVHFVRHPAQLLEPSPRPRWLRHLLRLPAGVGPSTSGPT